MKRDEVKTISFLSDFAQSNLFCVAKRNQKGGEKGCPISLSLYIHICTYATVYLNTGKGGGLGSRPKKMYGERLGDGVEYHLMKPTPRR